MPHANTPRSLSLSSSLLRISGAKESLETKMINCVSMSPPRYSFYLVGLVEIWARRYKNKLVDVYYSVYFWVRLCRWDSETFTLYQTMFS